MTARSAFGVSGLALGLAIVACGGGSSLPSTPSTPPTPAAATVASVAVSGSAPAVGLSSQLMAMATMSNGTTQNVSSQATWSSSTQSVAAVNSAGVVTGVSAGDVDITATYTNVAGRLRLTIQRPTAATYTLVGTITDATSGGILPGILVVVQDGGNAGRNATTNSGGTYTLADLAAGTFTLSAAASGYQTATKSVAVAANTRADFVLSRATAAPGPTPSPSSPACNGQSVPAVVNCLNNQGFRPPTAKCNDGEWSCSQSRPGTCSSHGGVACYVCPGPIC